MAIVRKRDFKCSAADRAVKVQDSIFESQLPALAQPRSTQSPVYAPFTRGPQWLSGGCE